MTSTISVSRRSFVWAAIAASTLVGGLTWAVLSASAEEQTSVNKTPPPPTPCQHECYADFGECNKAAGDDQNARMECKAAGNTCMDACRLAKATEKKEVKPVPACHRACYAAHGECMKAAGTDETMKLECKADGNTCLAACPPDDKKDKPASDQTYEQAVQAARQRFLDGQKKLLEEYQAALEKAWQARMKASTN